ncbi:PsbP domain-containing protein 6, chloroplastic [Dichanthelium oligosanthes]|uniref:PsbP domain-containing protein 6, chloroplastic n=1 Tax=Dichanthelium oligosanthes TaxID=888268 RepID=A0A1E5UJB0_9POAL|nr:PsbP domain-containing protein 6, chloroplastic [Dichanthelium oligosanthes]
MTRKQWHVLEWRVGREAILAERTPPPGPRAAAAGETEATGAASTAGAMLAECCRRSAAHNPWRGSYSPISYPQATELTRRGRCRAARTHALLGFAADAVTRTKRENIARARLDKALLPREPDATQCASPCLSPMASSVFSPLFPSLRLPAATSSRCTPPQAVPSADNAFPQPAPLVAVASHRRELVLGAALSALLSRAPLPAQAREVEVGTYLPPAPSNPGFVFFRATPKDTPALRAGNVQPYEFILPPTWKQTRVANILSGNYCQPKCAEPWVEVKFEDEKQGKVQVVASPLIRLTNKPNATIEDIGSPERLIASLGPFVTGNTFDSDELVDTNVEKIDGQTYYSYVLETPLALTGSHNLAKATAKGNTVVLFVASANDKQWSSSSKVLKAILDSFHV